MTTNPPIPPQGPLSRQLDRAFRLACQSCGVLIIIIVLGLLALLVQQSWPVLSRAGHFQLFTSSNWDPDGKTAGHPV